MIRVIAPFVDGFVPKKANKYRETRVEVTFKNSVDSVGGGGRGVAAGLPAGRRGDAGRGRVAGKAGGSLYFMNRLHINCRGSLRNWKKARVPRAWNSLRRERAQPEPTFSTTSGRAK